MSSNTLTLRKYFIWNSQWYCDYNYYNLLFEDIKINNYLQSIFYVLKFPTSNFIIKRYFYKIIIQSNLHIMFLFNRYFNTNKLMFFFKRHTKFLINHFVFKKSVYWFFKKIAIRLYYFLYSNNVNNFNIYNKINIPFLATEDSQLFNKYITNKLLFINHRIYKKETFFKDTINFSGAYTYKKSYFSHYRHVLHIIQDVVTHYNTVNFRYAHWYLYANYLNIYRIDKVFLRTNIFFKPIKNKINNIYNTNINLIKKHSIFINKYISTIRNSTFKYIEKLFLIAFSSFIYPKSKSNKNMLHTKTNSQILNKYLLSFKKEVSSLNKRHILYKYHNKYMTVLSNNLKDSLNYYTVKKKHTHIYNKLVRSKNNRTVLKNKSVTISATNYALLHFWSKILLTSKQYYKKLSDFVDINISSDFSKTLNSNSNSTSIKKPITFTRKKKLSMAWLSYVNKYKSTFYTKLFYSLFKNKESTYIYYFKIFYKHYLIIYSIYKLFRLASRKYISIKKRRKYNVPTTSNMLTGRRRIKYKPLRKLKNTQTLVINQIRNILLLKKDHLKKYYSINRVSKYLHTKTQLVNTFKNFKIKIKDTLLILFYELKSVVERNEYTKSKAKSVRIQIDTNNKTTMSKLFYSTPNKYNNNRKSSNYKHRVNKTNNSKNRKNNKKSSLSRKIIDLEPITEKLNKLLLHLNTLKNNIKILKKRRALLKEKFFYRYQNTRKKLKKVRAEIQLLKDEIKKKFSSKLYKKTISNTIVHVFKKYFNYYVTYNTYSKSYYIWNTVVTKVLKYNYIFVHFLRKKLNKKLSVYKFNRLIVYKLLLFRRYILSKMCRKGKIIFKYFPMLKYFLVKKLDLVNFKKGIYFKLLWLCYISNTFTEKNNFFFIKELLITREHRYVTSTVKMSTEVQRSVNTGLYIRNNCALKLYKGVYYKLSVLPCTIKTSTFSHNFMFLYLCMYYVYNKNSMFRYLYNILLLFSRKKQTNKINLISETLNIRPINNLVKSYNVRLYNDLENYKPFLKSNVTQEAIFFTNIVRRGGDINVNTSYKHNTKNRNTSLLLGNTTRVNNAVNTYLLVDIYSLSSGNFILSTWLLKKYMYKFINKLFTIVKYYVFCLVKSYTLLIKNKEIHNNNYIEIMNNIISYNSILRYLKVINNYTNFFKKYSKQTYLIDYIGNSTFISIIQNKSYYYFYIKYYIVTFWYLFYYIECTISKYSKINTFLLIAYNLNWEYYLNSAKMWCEYIVFQLKKRITIKKVFWYIKKQQIREQRNRLNYELNHPQNSELLSKYKYPLKGIRILYSGNLKKAKRKARLYYYVWLADLKYSGGMPIRKLKTYIDYYYSVAVLKRSSVGIKFWLLYDL